MDKKGEDDIKSFEDIINIDVYRIIIIIIIIIN